MVRLCCPRRPRLAERSTGRGRRWRCPWRPARFRHLRGHGRDGGECPPEHGPREPERHGPCGGEPVGHQPDRDEGAQSQARAESNDEGREERRLPAYDGRAQQFAPSCYFFGSGVADDGEQGRQPDQQDRAAQPPRRQSAEAVTVRVAVQRAQCRVCGDDVEV